MVLMAGAAAACVATGSSRIGHVGASSLSVRFVYCAALHGGALEEGREQMENANMNKLRAEFNDAAVRARRRIGDVIGSAMRAFGRDPAGGAWLLRTRVAAEHSCSRNGWLGFKTRPCIGVVFGYSFWQGLCVLSLACAAACSPAGPAHTCLRPRFPERFLNVVPTK